MADTSRGRIALVPETVFGVTPTDPIFAIQRVNSATLSYTKETRDSTELDGGAMLLDLVETGSNSGGTMPFEVSPDAHDVVIEAALRGTRSPVVASAEGLATIAFSSPTATVTHAGAFGSVVVGQWLLFRGWSNRNNNGWKQVATNPDDDTITISDANMIAEASGGAGTISGQTITNGVRERSFSLEESFTDREIYRLFKGQRVSTLSLDFAAGAILTGTFSTIGARVMVEDPGTGVDPSWLGAGSRTAKVATAVLNATANVGGVYLDGGLSSACFKAISVNIDNQLRTTQCVGSKYTSGVGYGQQRVSGSLTKLFNSAVLYSAMLNHADVSLSVGAYNSDGGVHVHLPRVKLGGDGLGLGGGNSSDVDEEVEWTALKGGVGIPQIRIDIAGAALAEQAGVSDVLSSSALLLHYWAIRGAQAVTA